eukprot:scaffold2858_cov109-Cylindrotheca_fusiformis.AAC.4
MMWSSARSMRLREGRISRIVSEAEFESELIDSYDNLLLGKGVGVPNDVHDDDFSSSGYTYARIFSIYKASKDETIGIEVGKDITDGYVIVTKIRPTSKFAATGLTPGMRILSINGRSCPASFQTVVLTIQETVGELRILAIGRAYYNRNTLDASITSKESEVPSLPSVVYLRNEDAEVLVNEDRAMVQEQY